MITSTMPIVLNFFKSSGKQKTFSYLNSNIYQDFFKLNWKNTVKFINK